MALFMFMSVGALKAGLWHNSFSGMGSGFFTAEISVRSPRKLLIFIMWKNMFWVKASNFFKFRFENRSNGCRWLIPSILNPPAVFGGSEVGFVFHAPCAGVVSRTGRAGAWPFWVVLRSSESGELSSPWLSTNDMQSSPIQIVNNIRITAIPQRCISAARRTVHTGGWRGRCGAPHKA